MTNSVFVCTFVFMTYSTGHKLTPQEIATAKALREATGKLRKGKITPDEYRSLMAQSRERHGIRHDLVKAAVIA